MNINFKKEKNTLFVDFNGELDHHNAKNVRERIDSYYNEEGFKNIVINLEGLNFMDSSGIGLVMGRYKLVNQIGGKLFLTNVNSRVRKILNMSGVNKIVKIYEDEKEVYKEL